MAALTDLRKILDGLNAEGSVEDYAFCVIEHADDPRLSGLTPFALVRESEGVTVVLKRDAAQRAGFEFEGAFRRITLGVHSSLQAVGLTAKVSGALAGRGIAANVIAGYYHDHVFVPADRIGDALAAIRSLT